MRSLPVRTAAFLTLLACGLEPGASVAVVRQQTVSFPTQDGGIIYADVYGTGERGLVLAHGGRFSKESWASQGPVLPLRVSTSEG